MPQILVVDDELLLRRTLRMALERAGQEVEEAKQLGATHTMNKPVRTAELLAAVDARLGARAGGQAS